MKQDIPEQVWTFWSNTMEKLDISENAQAVIPEVLEDLCRFFHFGCCFVYKSDHTGAYLLESDFALYANDHLQSPLDLRAAIGPDLLGQLTVLKSVVFDDTTEKTDLETALAAVFQANSMILLPICDKDKKVRALVGVVDRRGEPRKNTLDTAYSYSILRVIANHIKLQLYEERAHAAEQSLRTILDNMGIDVYVVDFYTREILYINRSMAEPYGGARRLLGQRCWEAFDDNMPGQCEHCPRDELVDEQGQPTRVASWDYRRAIDGTWFRVYSAAFHWMDGRLAQVVSRVDITESKRNEEIIRHLAELDSLTGLPNRRKLFSDCEQHLYTKPSQELPCYILFFDLDGFKKVNDTLGHKVGDELLCQIGKFLQESPLTAGKSYRQGGDEFVVFCPRASRKQVADIVALLLDRFEHPWELSGQDVSCRASIGVSCSPGDASTADQLLHTADLAMYAAKNLGGGALLYNGGDICSPEEFFGEKMGLPSVGTGS